jgi:predicted nucleic acid-binding protein
MMVCLDSCIVIDYVNGKIEIHDTQKQELYMSTIVENEVIVGAKNKRELATINKAISAFPLLDIDQDIMNLSTKLLNEYALSHGMSIYDAIIASTCMIYNLPLWTYNKKDFRFLDIELIGIK